MAFFAESTYEESYQDLGIVVNDYTDFDMLAMEACDVVQEMDNAIMQGIGHYELKTVREGSEVVYTEGMLDTIKSKIEKIWTFIKNWVKNVWNKFIAWIESYVRGDKAFLSKYKKKLDENLVYLDKDFSKTYKYAKLIDDDIDSVSNDIDKKLDSAFNDALNEIDAASDKENVSSLISDTLDKFDDKVSDAKEEYKDTDLEADVDASWIRKNFNTILEVIKSDASKFKRAADRESKNIDRDHKALIKKAQNEAKGLNQPEKSNVNAAINGFKSLSTKASNYRTWKTSFMIKCIKGAKSDARSMCRAILTAKPNPKYNESAFDHNDFEAYFNI
jgi:hypothetical protein|nr:MAG TPA: hypothetical protein [Caudoviricetes sp.]